MSNNPYRVRGDRTPRLYGREELLERLLRHLTKATPDHVSVVGPTLFGKSVLLSHVASCRSIRDHYVASVYWDLRHGTPPTNEEFLRGFAKETRDALARAELDLVDYLEPDSDELNDELHLVFDELEKAGYRLLAILDGFDHILAKTEITRSLWDNMRDLAQNGSLRLVTGSRRRLRELCKTEESRTSDFWEIFYDTPVEIGCFFESDWSGFLAPLQSRGFKLDESARKEIVNWTGGVPILAAALANRLYLENPRAVTLSKSQVDSAAEKLLETPGESLAALWDDCSIELKSDLTELARGALRGADIPPPRRGELELRGFATHSRGRLQSSCRFMKRYAELHGEGVTSLRRLFGDSAGFEGNIRGVLELRLEQVSEVDPGLLSDVREAVRLLYPVPTQSVVWARSVAEHALRLIWNAELPPDRSVPEEWKFAGVIPDEQGRLPQGLGAQCAVLRKITTGPGSVAKHVTRPTALLVDHIHAVGNFGQHKGGQTVSVGFAAAFCLSAIALCERLAEDLRS